MDNKLVDKLKEIERIALFLANEGRTGNLSVPDYELYTDKLKALVKGL